MEQSGRKRNRISLSCTYCKKRKVKCDRGQPCLSCVKHNVGSSCTYPAPTWRNPIDKANSDSDLDARKTSKSPTFHVQRFDITRKDNNIHENGLHESNFLLNYTNPPLQSELDLLKSKIKQIEASIHKNEPSHDNADSRLLLNRPETSNDATFSTSTSLSSYTLSNPRANQGNFRIKLPPINWKPQPTATTNLRDIGNNPFSNESIDSKLLQFDVNSNPTFLGINPYFSDNDTIDFYSGYSPIRIKEARRLNYGPFSWLALMKKDVGLSRLWQFMMSKRFEKIRNSLASGKHPLEGSIKPNGNDNDKETRFRRKAIDRYGYRDLMPYKKHTRSQSESSSMDSKSKETGDGCPRNVLVEQTDTEYSPEKDPSNMNEDKSQDIAMNKHAIVLGLSVFEGKIDQELHLIEKIKMILPKQKVMWLLISRFFKFVYPFMPFVDEESFKTEMNRITGPEDYLDKKLDLKIEKRLDFAFVGILMIILRLAYLTLFSNKSNQNQNNLQSTDPSPKAQETKYLLSNPVTINVIDMAKLCLDQFDLLRNTNLTILQFSFFMRLYNMYAPEDGDGSDGGDSQIFNGMLIQMAYSIGINREPNNFEDVYDDSKTKNLGRKMWYFLKISDITQAYQYGNPLAIAPQFYDASLPYYEKGNENIANIEMEKNVISTYGYFEKYYYHIQRILDLSLNIQKPANISLLTRYLSEFEIVLSENYGTIGDFLSKFDAKIHGFPFIKALKCRNYMNIKTFLLTVYFQIYSHYEKNNKQEYANFYLKKSFSTMSIEFVPVLFQLILNNDSNFGESTDLLLNPAIESLIHKINHINFSLLIKINCFVYLLKSDESHETYLRDAHYKSRFSILTRISKILEIITRYGIAALSRLSNRYYYAWRVTKAHTFFLKLATVEEFYKFWVQQGGMTSIDFNIEQLKEFLVICETSYNNISRGKLFHKIIGENFQDEIIEMHKAQMNDVYLPVIDPHKVDSESNAYGQVYNKGESVSSIDSSEIEVFENADIDRLWFQMATMKNDLTNKKSNNDLYMNSNATSAFNGNHLETNSSNFNGTFSQPVEQAQDHNEFATVDNGMYSAINFDNFANLENSPFNPVFDMFENFQVDQILNNMGGDYIP